MPFRGAYKSFYESVTKKSGAGRFFVLYPLFFEFLY
jgi:hypothetical protein